MARVTSRALSELVYQTMQEVAAGQKDPRVLLAVCVGVNTIVHEKRAVAAMVSLPVLTADLVDFVGGTDAAPAELLEDSIGIAPLCTGCQRHRVPGGGLCRGCADDERRAP